MLTVNAYTYQVFKNPEIYNFPEAIHLSLVTDSACPLKAICLRLHKFTHIRNMHLFSQAYICVIAVTSFYPHVCPHVNTKITKITRVTDISSCCTPPTISLTALWSQISPLTMKPVIPL